jgi:excisionase family DNA binding protein
MLRFARGRAHWRSFALDGAPPHINGGALVNKLLTTRQAATALGLHVATVRKLVARGEIRAVWVGARLRFEAAELEAFVRTSTAARARR